MSLVFDDTGARYFETGVSKGIFFPMSGPGVPWNGLVGVALDPSGGEPEAYYYDGVKYMDRILAEEFQATVTSFSTPREFEPCEGVKDQGFGMKTHFNLRAKFNMCWRTEIYNDTGASVGYKIHIAYNCTVQPSARAYQTISDNVTPDTRSFVITTTPACGRHSYFTFSSLEGDLEYLESSLYDDGALPPCYELRALVGDGSGGDGTDDNCQDVDDDLELYLPGQQVDFEETTFDHHFKTYGLINNGLNIVYIPANGDFAANDSDASVVGTEPVLADDDDDTYITLSEGDAGWTVQLPVLQGYIEGSQFELHIRMAITGDINEDDPDNLDADAQVFVTTDADGDLAVGGFSDGTDEGVGFALTSVDGTIIDYVVPLMMDPWTDKTIDDVVAALEDGAYLNFVGATNNNEDTAATVTVYEAMIVMLDTSDPEKWLRTRASSEQAVLIQTFYDNSDDGGS